MIKRLSFQNKVFLLAKTGYYVIKVKVVQYTFVRKGLPVREDTYHEPVVYKYTY